MKQISKNFLGIVAASMLAATTGFTATAETTTPVPVMEYDKNNNKINDALEKTIADGTYPRYRSDGKFVDGYVDAIIIHYNVPTKIDERIVEGLGGIGISYQSGNTLLAGLPINALEKLAKGNNNVELIEGNIVLMPIPIVPTPIDKAY